MEGPFYIVILNLPRLPCMTAVPNVSCDSNSPKWRAVPSLVAILFNSDNLAYSPIPTGTMLTCISSISFSKDCSFSVLALTMLNESLRKSTTTYCKHKMKKRWYLFPWFSKTIYKFYQIWAQTYQSWNYTSLLIEELLRFFQKNTLNNNNWIRSEYCWGACKYLNHWLYCISYWSFCFSRRLMNLFTPLITVAVMYM